MVACACYVVVGMHKQEDPLGFLISLSSQPLSFRLPVKSCLKNWGEEVTEKNALPSISGLHKIEHTYTHILYIPAHTHVHISLWIIWTQNWKRYKHDLLCKVQRKLFLLVGFRVGHWGETQTLALFNPCYILAMSFQFKFRHKFFHTRTFVRVEYSL